MCIARGLMVTWLNSRLSQHYYRTHLGSRNTVPRFVRNIVLPKGEFFYLLKAGFMAFGIICEIIRE
jgi:hypothetical protein